MHTTNAPKKKDMTIKLGKRPKNRMPIAGKGQSTRFGNWRHETRAASKVKLARGE